MHCIAVLDPRDHCPACLQNKLKIAATIHAGINNGGKKGCDTCVTKIIPELDAGLLANIDFPALFAYMKDPESTLKEKMKGVYNSCHSKFRRALRRKGVSDKDVLKFRRNLESCSWNIDK